MKVAYGLTQYSRGMLGTGIDGIGNYSYELLAALSKRDDLDLSLYSYSYNLKESLFGHKLNILNKVEIEFFKSMFIKKFQTGEYLTGSRVDIVHATDHVIPLVNNVPLVSTICDAIMLSNPEWTRQQKVNFLNNIKYAFWKKAARRSDAIITLSEYSKNQISNYFNIPNEKIKVVPLGVDARFFEKISIEEQERIRGIFKIPEHFFINIGTLQPRKNIGQILNAMRLLSLEFRRAHPIVIVGKFGWGVDSLVSEISVAQSEGWCVWLNRLSDYELRALLQASTALVFPSLSEGFGLPVLEAFASNTTVITSSTTSLPEAANGCAKLVSPLSAEEIAAALVEVVEGAELYSTLKLKAYQHALNMTWHRCAEKTFQVYKSIP